LKFVDGKNKKTGHTTVDFRNINFNGWIDRNDTAYTFLSPSTRRTKPFQEPEPWTKIEVFMSKGKSVLARSREKAFGCLLDIQSYVHTGEYVGVDTHV